MSEYDGVSDLRDALVALRHEFDLASVTASNVMDDGALVTIAVYRSFATISDDRGHVHAIALSEG